MNHPIFVVPAQSIQVHFNAMNMQQTRILSIARPSLRLDAPTFRLLLELPGPSLALLRAAEIATPLEPIFKRPILYLGFGDCLVPSMVLSPCEVCPVPD